MQLTAQIQLETDFMDAEAVDGFADVGAFIIALQSLDRQRKSFATNTIAIPELGHPLAILHYQINNMKKKIRKRTATGTTPSYPIPFDERFGIGADGTNQTDSIA